MTNIGLNTGSFFSIFLFLKMLKKKKLLNIEDIS